jgi:hypothetical protein
MNDEMKRSTQAWFGSEKFLTSSLQLRADLARKMEQQIVVPLLQFYSDAELKRKIIIKVLRNSQQTLTTQG